MYLYKDLWKILLQHLWNHYITTLSTVRETCVHIEQGISAHMVRWDLNEGLVFVRRLVRGLVLTLRYQSKRYRVGIYTLVSSKLAMWTHSFPLNWCSVFPIQTGVWRCYGKRIVRCFIPEVDRWGRDSVRVRHVLARCIVEILLHFWYRDVVMFRINRIRWLFMSIVAHCCDINWRHECTKLCLHSGAMASSNIA